MTERVSAYLGTVYSLRRSLIRFFKWEGILSTRFWVGARSGLPAFSVDLCRTNLFSQRINVARAGSFNSRLGSLRAEHLRVNATL